LIAHVNTAGVHVPLWLDSDPQNNGVGWGTNPSYPAQEGSFMGNLFTSPPIAYYCNGRDWDISIVPGRIGANQVNAPYKMIPGEPSYCQDFCTPSDSYTNGKPDGYKACAGNNQIVTVWRGLTAIDGTTASVTASGASPYFNDTFESDATGAQATGWTRVGGSGGDWLVTTDGSKVFGQNRSNSSSLRFVYAGPAATGVESIEAKVKVTLKGSSGTTSAMTCLRYSTDGNYICLAIQPGVGAQIKTKAGDGPTWSTNIAVGTWYDVKLSVDGSGTLSGYVGGQLLGTFKPSSVSSGYAALGTQSGEANFDNVSISSP